MKGEDGKPGRKDQGVCSELESLVGREAGGAGVGGHCFISWGPSSWEVGWQFLAVHLTTS